MARIVAKFGGTSVADLDRIRAVATRVQELAQGGDEVAVVVSAMAGTTDTLVGYVKDLAPGLDGREYDTVVSAGEQVSAGLTALALQTLGLRARSFMGWQAPVNTDQVHGNARVRGIDTGGIEACLNEGTIAVLAGFQGVGPDRRITTLGRGGTDTSAVALAAALRADRCDIFTDVDGVYTADPRIVAKAHKLDKITYEEMLEMASVGARVLQTRSVETAMKHRVRVQVLSSLNRSPGTMVVDETEILDKGIVSAIACSRDEAKITLQGLADRPGVAAAVFGPLADANINVDMIVQSSSHDGKATDITFTVTRADLDKARALIEALRAELGIQNVLADDTVAKVSVVGVGMRSHAGVAKLMFATLAEKGINIHVISTSEIKVSVLVAEDYVELAQRALHTAYGLDAD
ncbi:MAG TPA: aspartate kinase [Alphaproteobacteria bacterium]|nr:aspartate kinase [Alphaproteobacteria bacterium]